MKISKSDPILIIGAGISGLTTAVALYQKGFTNIKLFEKNTHVENAEPVFLGANALAALEDITLGEVIRGEGHEWEGLEWRWQSDSLVKRLDLTPVHEKRGFRPLTMTWDSYRAVMLRELPADCFQPEAEYISFTQTSRTVEAHFANDRTETGELLIGADGLRSRVRMQLKGDSPIRESGRIYISGIVDRGQLKNPGWEAIESPYVEWMGKGKSVSISRFSGTDVLFQMSVPLTGAAPEALKPWLQEAFEKWPDPILELLELAEESDLHTAQPADRAPAKGWSDGRVVMVGDSIHPTMPFLGMEADMAVESAVLLASLLDETGALKKAFKTYEKTRRKRTRLARRSAARYVRFLNKGGRISYALRGLLPLVPDIIDAHSIYKLQMDGFRE